MPYNIYGDLKKGEVVIRLQEMGYQVKSVNALNRIMEEMGLHENTGSGWLTTTKGLDYAMGSEPCFNEISWHATLVDTVAGYLDNKR